MPGRKGSTALVVEGDPVMPNSPGFPKPGPEMVRLPTTDIAFLSVACMAKAACNKPSGEEARDTKLVAFTVSTWIPSSPAELGRDFVSGSPAKFKTLDPELRTRDFVDGEANVHINYWYGVCVRPHRRNAIR